jgi:ankyrin repeat protein
LVGAGANIEAVLPGSNEHPLHSAVLSRSVERVDALIQLGANLNSLDSQGKTPLHLACTPFPYKPFCEPIIKLLLANGAGVSIKDHDLQGPDRPNETKRSDASCRQEERRRIKGDCAKKLGVGTGTQLVLRKSTSCVPVPTPARLRRAA